MLNVARNLVIAKSPPTRARRNIITAERIYATQQRKVLLSMSPQRLGHSQRLVNIGRSQPGIEEGKYEEATEYSPANDESGGLYVGRRYVSAVLLADFLVRGGH